MLPLLDDEELETILTKNGNGINAVSDVLNLKPNLLNFELRKILLTLLLIMQRISWVTSFKQNLIF
jgi:hypothetical protein